MENTSLLPEVSEKADVILMQLMKAKAEMGSAVKKDSANPFHKSKYASLGAHLELSEGVLFKHGLLMLHAANIMQGQHILVATLFHPESGQWLKCYLPLPNPKADSQGIGASLTYMRRYSINSMLGLNAEDDDGETASGRGKYDKQQSKTEPLAAKNQGELEVKLGQKEISILNPLFNVLNEKSKASFLDWTQKNFKTKSLQEIPMMGFERSLSAIKYVKDQEKVAVQ